VYATAIKLMWLSVCSLHIGNKATASNKRHFFRNKMWYVRTVDVILVIFNLNPLILSVCNTVLLQKPVVVYLFTRFSAYCGTHGFIKTVRHWILSKSAESTP
jgi:hypothetical protein